MIEWNDSLSIGVEEIDQQHRELIRRFNDYSQAVSQGYDKEKLVELLLFMRAYAVFHFKAEEDLMYAIGFPGLDSHKREHEEFMGKQYWLYECSRFNDDLVAQEAEQYLGNWITSHVAVRDKKIGEWVASQTVS